MHRRHESIPKDPLNNHLKAGQKFNVDLQLRYLSPGAFTVLPPEDVPPPDPPQAPPPYRLTPTTRRSRNQSFSIIAEPTNSRGNSRSPSPTTGGGRGLSPFRGRGFNPAGSRHASPQPSPPPRSSNSRQKSAFEDSKPPKPSPSRRKSRIPQMKRRNSSSVLFGETVTNTDSELSSSSPGHTNNRYSDKSNNNLSKTMSKSMNNVNSNKVSNRPSNASKIPATPVSSFRQLSPIIGSSPEPSQSQSSPSIKSRSQPQSRLPSPLSGTRIESKSKSRLNSRDPSPSKILTTKPQTSKSYQNVQPKVNSYSNGNSNSKSKPKVLPHSSKFNSPTTKTSPLNFNSDSDVSMKNGNKANSSNDTNKKQKNVNSTTPSTKKSNNSKADVNGNSTKNDPKVVEKKEDKPIETMNHEESKKMGISPMVDGRVLSATSVSQAINRMNDTVLDTKTLMRETGFSKLSPAANAIISMSRETKKSSESQLHKQEESLPKTNQQKTDNDSVKVENKNPGKTENETATRTANDESEKHEKEEQKSSLVGNHTTSTGLTILDNSDLKNSTHELFPVSGNNGVKKGIFSNELGETVPSVHPLQILVKEKADSLDVESGNMGIPVSSVTNGSISHGNGPSLPPDNSSPKNNESNKQGNNDHKPTKKPLNFFKSAKEKILCISPKEGRENDEQNHEHDSHIESAGEMEEKTGCFGRTKRKSNRKIGESITIHVEEDGKESTARRKGLKPLGNLKFWGKRSAEPSADRRDSILSEISVRPSFSSRFQNFTKKLFCAHLCRRKKIVNIETSRTASVISKKKSLTPTTLPPEDQTPKLDLTLVEHTSHMKAAIPVLPICLAWFCLVMNCLLPGTGTVLSGLLCLCFGIPRFSQQDSMRSRIGALIIDCLVGFSQCFTILFCLVGWGWSIWWGVIMVKLARKYKKIAGMEMDKSVPGGKERISLETSNNPTVTRFQDPERGV